MPYKLRQTLLKWTGFFLLKRLVLSLCIYLYRKEIAQEIKAATDRSGECLEKAFKADSSLPYKAGVFAGQSEVHRDWAKRITQLYLTRNYDD